MVRAMLFDFVKLGHLCGLFKLYVLLLSFKALFTLSVCVSDLLYDTLVSIAD